jgi:hypothetical protein
MKRVGLALILAAAASAQQFDWSSPGVWEHQVTGVFGPPRIDRIVTGAPYSADELNEFTESDGTPPRVYVINHYARDAQGRTRMERGYHAAPIRTTEIFDPVAGIAYLLDDQNRVAHRMLLPPAVPITPVSSEKLGTKLMEGVLVAGTRTVNILTIDTWVSPELKITLHTKSSNGYSSRLTGLTRTDPAPALFQPPPGYTVVDETGPFPMAIPIR